MVRYAGVARVPHHDGAKMRSKKRSQNLIISMVVSVTCGATPGAWLNSQAAACSA
jgi:hypothetical protein